MWNENSVNPQRPRSVSSRKTDKNSGNKSSAVDDDITFRINGEKMSKNRYFFGGELKSALKSASKSANKNNNQTSSNKNLSSSAKSETKGSEAKNKKTALDIFLEDKGPYSRKLYGPPPGGQSQDHHESSSSSKNNNRKRARSQEVLLQLHGNISEVSPIQGLLYLLGLLLSTLYVPFILTPLTTKFIHSFGMGFLSQLCENAFCSLYDKLVVVL